MNKGKLFFLRDSLVYFSTTIDCGQIAILLSYIAPEEFRTEDFFISGLILDIYGDEITKLY